MTIVQKIERNSESILAKLLERGQAFPAALHGGFWSHNILVHANTSNPNKVINWQGLVYADPAFELATYICFWLPLNLLSSDCILDSAEIYYKHYVKHGGTKDKRS